MWASNNHLRPNIRTTLKREKKNESFYVKIKHKKRNREGLTNIASSIIIKIIIMMIMMMIKNKMNFIL